jgi:hypothetical protein
MVRRTHGHAFAAGLGSLVQEPSYFALDFLAFSVLRRFSRTAARSRMIFDRSAGGILAQASRTPRPADALPPRRPSSRRYSRSAFDGFDMTAV